MFAQYKFPSSETVLLNLTETLLGPDIDRQAIYCRNIGIQRRLSNLSVLCIKEQGSVEGVACKCNQSIEYHHVDKVIFGTIGNSRIAILPQKISNLLKKGWSYQYRLSLLWATLKKMNLGDTGVVCLPDAHNSPKKISDISNDFRLIDVLRPLGKFTTNLDNNLLLCNPAYYSCLIVGDGLTQEEFQHVELYIRCGGNIILNTEHVVLDRKLVEKQCAHGDQLCLNF